MTNPWMIMIVGVLTVFISLFIMIFALLAFPGFFAAIKRREHKELAPLPQIVEVSKKKQAQPVGGQTVQEDDALIAVLAAAVAEASGSRPGSFAITQVRQSPAESVEGFNTPIWGRVERLSRNER
ncbi:MAG TPA: OadG family protein [Rectinema sp.]|nr:OadG family protein [Rectinema sp.]